MLNQALLNPKPIPNEPTIHERLKTMYEDSAESAFNTLKSLMVSPKDEVKLAAAKAILDKVVPDKLSDQFAFLMHKSEEELIAIVAGSGLLADSARAYAKKQVGESVSTGAPAISQDSSPVSGK